MTTKTAQYGVPEIILTRAEGLAEECDRPVRVSRWEDAAHELARMARSAPKPGGGYDKTDFLVVWEDGETYEGRYDLQRDGESGSAWRGFDLARRVRDFLAFLAHKPSCPGHFACKAAPMDAAERAEAAVARTFMAERLPDVWQPEPSSWWCCERREGR